VFGGVVGLGSTTQRCKDLAEIDSPMANWPAAASSHPRCAWPTAANAPQYRRHGDRDDGDGNTS